MRANANIQFSKQIKYDNIKIYKILYFSFRMICIIIVNNKINVIFKLTNLQGHCDMSSDHQDLYVFVVCEVFIGTNYVISI